MTRTKKFKTVAGYLRSAEDRLYSQRAMAELQGQPAIAEEDGKRQIINSMLPQLGLERLQATEAPRDGIKRLQQTAQTDQQKKALDACLGGLGEPSSSAPRSPAFASSTTRSKRGLRGRIAP